MESVAFGLGRRMGAGPFSTTIKKMGNPKAPYVYAYSENSRKLKNQLPGRHFFEISIVGFVDMFSSQYNNSKASLPKNDSAAGL